jgi:hypothetical protein
VLVVVIVELGVIFVDCDVCALVSQLAVFVFFYELFFEFIWQVFTTSRFRKMPFMIGFLIASGRAPTAVLCSGFHHDR